MSQPRTTSLTAGSLALLENDNGENFPCRKAAAFVNLSTAPREVVEGATLGFVVTGVPTMLAIGIVLNSIGLGFFCWVLSTLAIYALPVFVGMSAGLYVHDSGVGPIGAIVLGLMAAASVLVIGQIVFSIVRTPALRIVVALAFAIPAALAGYYTTFGLSGLTMTSGLLRQGFAVAGAVAVGATAWLRLAAPPPDILDASGQPARS